jgi:hypothetical protein
VSRGRSRSWRSEKKTGGRDTRRRTIVMLIVALAALLGFLVLPMLSRDPGFRTAVMAPPSNGLTNSAFCVQPSSASLRAAPLLTELFQNLHDRNPGRVAAPGQVQSLADVASLAADGEKLLLYCSWEPVAENSGQPVLLLNNGTEAPPIPFADLLEKLKALQASQILLVMDFVQRDTGIANGRLSDDVLQLMRSSVAEAKMPELMVICPHQTGERNWEPTLPLTSTVDDAEVIGATAEATSTSTADAVGGTIFANALGRAFLQGRFQTVDELLKSIRTDVADQVPSGEVQTVCVIPETSPVLRQDLLLRAQPPAFQDESDSGTDDVPDDESSESPKAAAKSNDPAATAGVDPPEQQWNKLFQRRQQLAATGAAAAMNPVEWTQLTVSLVNARWALMNAAADDNHFRIEMGQASTRIQEFELDLTDTASEQSQASFAPWLFIRKAGATTLTPERAQIFDEVFRNLRQKTPTGDLPFELRSAEARAEFTDWFVQQVQTLSKTLETLPTEDEQLAKVAEFHRFINHLPKRGWPDSQWPEPLFTVDEILGQEVATEPVATVRALSELLRIRRQALECATGTLDGAPFRRVVWDSVADQLRVLLLQLTSAERWLALGPRGLKMGQQKLGDAASKWSDIQRSVKALHEVSTFPDLQQTELPFLIQYLAQQQEEVAVTQGELDAALSVADHVLNDSELTAQEFSLGVYSGTGLSTNESEAMFRLTRNLAADGPQDTDLQDQDLSTLNDYVTRQWNAGPGGIEGRRVVSLLAEPRSIADCVSHLLRSPGPSSQQTQRQTGIRLSAWSIRLLDAVTHQVHKDLWRQWQALVEAIRDHQGLKEITASRTKLATSLTNTWLDFRSTNNGVSAADLFVTQQNASGLLAADLAERANAGTSNSKVYRLIYQENLATAPPLSMPSSYLNIASAEAGQPAEALVNSDNIASVKLDSKAARIYVSKSALVPTTDAVVAAGWHLLDQVNGSTELTLRAANVYSTTETLQLVAANENDVVFAVRELTVYPNAATEWELLVGPVGGNNLLRDGTELKLPPTTLTPENKDAPIPLLLRLAKRNGVAAKANVKIVAIQVDGQETPLGNREVSFVDSDTVVIPFTTADASAKEVAAIASAVPVKVDVRGGIRLEVTPVLKGAQTSSFIVRPMIADAEEYVDAPEWQYNPTQQKLTISVHRKPNVASLPLSVLPVEFHFNTLLSGLLVTDLSSPKKAELEKGSNKFNFVFSDELRRLLNETEKQEFAMSVAGIPQVWRWRLENDGPVLLASDKPVISAELTVQESADVKVLKLNDELLLGADWPKAKLDVSLHIHGGQFGFRQGVFTPRHEVKLRLAKQNAPSITVYNQDVYTRQVETIEVSSAENGAWNFSTNTASYQKIGYQIAQNNLQAGKYELIAELSTPGDTGTLSRDTQQFVFDDTEPKFGEPAVAFPVDEFRMGGLIEGRVNVTDPESGIAEIKVGFKKDKLTPIPLSGSFKLPGNSAGVPRPSAAVPGQTERATLYVEVTNHAQLTELIEIDVVFVASAMKNAVTTPGKTGTVEFKFAATRQWTAELRRGGATIQDATGASPIVFSDVPVGTYTIFWKTGVNAQAGLTDAFSVKQGESTEVAP